jgi:hypothetical protein
MLISSPDSSNRWACLEAEPGREPRIQSPPRCGKTLLLAATKIHLRWLTFFLIVASMRAEVRVFIQDSNGVASVNYQCTAGEVVRAFALDVSVDRGQILGVSNYFRGQSVAGATGYGIFPASLRDHITIGSGTNINWNVSGYTPLAAVGDNPGGTLPGLNSSGVTLEFGGVWDPTQPAAVPGPAGTLCTLILSQAARVSVAANTSRGGVISAIPGVFISPIFTGAPVGPAIINTTLGNGVITILFQGGELQTASGVNSQWTDTGDVSGQHTESLGTNQLKYFRVRSP